MKKVIIGIVVVIIIILIAMYMRSGSGYQAASADTSFEDDAAAILSTNATPQAKIDQLNARLAQKKARAAKIGAVTHPVPTTATTH